MKRVSRNLRRTAVTLIETILVVVLLAASAVTGLIMFDSKWVARRSVSNATNEVANSLVAARNSAITNQATVRVRRVRRRGVQQLVITEDAGPYRQGRNRLVDMGSDVRLRGQPREIRFSPSGTANRRLAWSIRESNVTGRVRVSPTSGQINRVLP